MFVCSKCGELSTMNYKRPSNPRVWVVGQNRSNGFQIRLVFHELDQAQAQKRADEEIRGGLVSIERLVRRGGDPRDVKGYEHPENDQPVDSGTSSPPTS